MGNCKLSYLLFSDELLDVGKPNTSTANSLEYILVKFYSYMEVSINKDKLPLYGKKLHSLQSS